MNTENLSTTLCKNTLDNLDAKSESSVDSPPPLIRPSSPPPLKQSPSPPPETTNSYLPRIELEPEFITHTQKGNVKHELRYAKNDVVISDTIYDRYNMFMTHFCSLILLVGVAGYGAGFALGYLRHRGPSSSN